MIRTRKYVGRWNCWKWKERQSSLKCVVCFVTRKTEKKLSESLNVNVSDGKQRGHFIYDYDKHGIVV